MAIIKGTSGDDRADLGGNNLIGTSSMDEIYGYAGSDWLDGGGGNDTLDAGSGDRNTVFGGAGNDLVRTAGYDGFYDGGTGFDTIQFQYAQARNGVFDLAQGYAQLFAATVTQSDGPRFLILNFEALHAGAGDDTILGTEGRNILGGGAGDDDITARGGDDHVLGGAGDDTLDGGAGNDTLYGDDGRDELYGGDGADRLVGGKGDDFLWGGLGNDMLEGGIGNDTLDGMSGFDTASYAGVVARVFVDMTRSEARSTANGVSEIDKLYNIDKVIGSIKDDQMIAGATTALDGGAGNDRLTSGSGANDLAGGSGIDTLSYAGSIGGVGVDLSLGTATGGWAQGDRISGFENVLGGAGEDGLIGDNRANLLSSQGGRDYIHGGGGNDTLIGGDRSDLLHGGTGADRFVYLSSTDSRSYPECDFIHDFSRGEGDRIDLSLLDANADLFGRQGFSFLPAVQNPASIGWSAEFTAGKVLIARWNGETRILINLSDAVDDRGYDTPEMEITLIGDHALTQADFLL